MADKDNKRKAVEAETASEPPSKVAKRPMLTKADELCAMMLGKNVRKDYESEDDAAYDLYKHILFDCKERAKNRKGRLEINLTNYVEDIADKWCLGDWTLRDVVHNVKPIFEKNGFEVISDVDFLTIRWDK